MAVGVVYGNGNGVIGPTQHTDVSVQTDFGQLYGNKEPPLDLFKQNFRVLCRSAGTTYDLSKFVTQLVWTDQGTDNYGITGTMPINEPLTGTLTMSKPNLLQYPQLVPPFLSASVDGATATARAGALGVVIICEVGYENKWSPLWAMRVVPGTGIGGVTSSTGLGAEQVELEDGTWTLSLADDTYQIDQSTYDFKYTKGNSKRKQGWRVHEIADEVCKLFSIPVSTLASGTAWLGMNPKDTHGISPLTMIMLAYQQETTKTGKTFVVQWAAPSTNYPLGSLSVVPLRRNPNLLVFREQLIDAILTRTQSADFCSVVDARGTLKQAKGKHKQVKKVVSNDQAIRRYGYVRKIIYFNDVSSTLELELLAKRALAYRLTPIRTAELINPGIATVRRGDAIRINLPEEGYAEINLASDGTPKAQGGSKASAAALTAAEKDDPNLYGLPGSKNVAQVSSTSVDDVLFGEADVNVLTVPDQGIAFVEYVQHTVSAGSYQVDIQTGFTDMLDPQFIQQEIDNAKRAAKAASQAASNNSGNSSGSTGGSSGASGSVRDRIVSYARAGTSNGTWVYADTPSLLGRDRPIPNGATVFNNLSGYGTIYTDCSGFATMVYQAAGAPDPNGGSYNGSGATASMQGVGTKVATPQAGDLALWSGPGHVAVCLDSSGTIAEFGYGTTPIISTVNDEDGAHASFLGYRSYVS